MNQKTLASLIILIVAFAVVWWMVLPAWSDFSAARDLKIRKAGDLAKQNLILEKVENWKKDFEANKDGIERAAEALPPDMNLPQLVSLTDELAKQSGLVVLSYEASELKKDSRVVVLSDSSAPPLVEKFKKTIVESEFLGTYDSLLKFLIGLESALRIGDVDQLSIAPADKAGQFEMFLGIKFYNK